MNHYKSYIQYGHNTGKRRDQRKLLPFCTAVGSARRARPRSSSLAAPPSAGRASIIGRYCSEAQYKSKLYLPARTNFSLARLDDFSDLRRPAKQGGSSHHIKTGCGTQEGVSNLLHAYIHSNYCETSWVGRSRQ